MTVVRESIIYYSVEALSETAIHHGRRVCIAWWRYRNVRETAAPSIILQTVSLTLIFFFVTSWITSHRLRADTHMCWLTHDSSVAASGLFCWISGWKNKPVAVLNVVLSLFISERLGQICVRGWRGWRKQHRCLLSLIKVRHFEIFYMGLLGYLFF